MVVWSFQSNTEGARRLFVIKTHGTEKKDGCDPDQLSVTQHMYINECILTNQEEGIWKDL